MKQTSNLTNTPETKYTGEDKGDTAFQVFLPDCLRGKRPKDMSQVEKKQYNRLRMQFNRSQESESETLKRKMNDAEQQKKKKSEETQEQSKTRKIRIAQSIAKARRNETEEMSRERKMKDTDQKKRRILEESQDNAEERKRNKAQNMAKARINETEEMFRKRKVKDSAQKARAKANKKPISHYLARNAQQVLVCTQIVKELKNTEDKIGSMDKRCSECNALKWTGETATICCKQGKVCLESFPDPPKMLQDLWIKNTAEARIFRENARSFNNALALSSLIKNERKFVGFSPSVVFEGKVHQRYGPLMSENGEQPQFAQVYIHDPATQHSVRFKNMYLPQSVTKKQRMTISHLLKDLQNLMIKVNPYVQDFMLVCEIPDEEIKDGKLLISCKGPPGTHERRYNLQQCFSEVSLLTNSEPNDLILRKRGGGLRTIYDLHPAAQPLHFTLLFPYGTKGYDGNARQKGGSRRVTPREFFTYHLNMRDHSSDFLFRAKRLFQEYICLCFNTVESQRLKFARNNQKALRADSYKNIKEILKEKVPMIDKIRKDDFNLKTGRKIILPSSFVGSPRWYNSQFQDGMAICREFHKPDFFITMTCNPHWSEITNELRDGEITQDRPDLVARVFKQKKDQLIKDIRSGRILGKVPAILHVIEFQKRGLPHVHILVILTDDDRIQNSNDIDNIICAQLPPDPEIFLEGSEKKYQVKYGKLFLK